jgi:hypothetical protein
LGETDVNEEMRRIREERDAWRANGQQNACAVHTPDTGATLDPDVTHPSGMVRGSTAGKVNYLLVYDGPMFERWAVHLTNAVESKGKRNWMNAESLADLERFREGFARHSAQWLRGDDDEDHAASIIFNLNGAEFVAQKLRDADVKGNIPH